MVSGAARFAQDGIEGLKEEYRAGRPRRVYNAQVAQVVERTFNTIPRDARAGPFIRQRPIVGFRTARICQIKDLEAVALSGSPNLGGVLTLGKAYGPNSTNVAISR